MNGHLCFKHFSHVRNEFLLQNVDGSHEKTFLLARKRKPEKPQNSPVASLVVLVKVWWRSEVSAAEIFKPVSVTVLL